MYSNDHSNEVKEQIGIICSKDLKEIKVWTSPTFVQIPIRLDLVINDQFDIPPLKTIDSVKISNMLAVFI